MIAALLTYLAEEQERGTATFRTFCLVNLGFALWFLMRNDVLPGMDCCLLGAFLAGGGAISPCPSC